MFIPDPSRLFPPKVPSSSSNSSYSLAGGLLALGALGLAVAAAVFFG